ncbi:MAG TPA: glycosyltransferase family 2 protein [Rhizomicrobium sp.]|jgi:glycosyltransferase involved in cell wall biosynthesis|nr:glycosyltransferase family 2 protein [Rhizomicrobium sp.]
MSDNTVPFSLLIAVMNEEENIKPVLREIAGALKGRDPASYEIVFVDDGSTDNTVRELLDMKSEMPMLRLVQHDRNYGKSTALRTGFLAARNNVVVTMDGDGQNDPNDILRLVAPFQSGDPALGLVAGQRIRRADTVRKQIASRYANKLRQALLKDGARDSVCGLKAIRRDVFLQLPFFDNMHRFFIALVIREGYRTELIDVVDRPRAAGTSKYGVLDRLLVGIPDLFGMVWLRKRFRGAPKPTEL